MADNLIFPIGFDLERGVKDAQAQMDSALRRLQKTVDGKPLTIPMSLDASKFTTFEAALRGSIQHITDDAKNLKAALDNSLQTDNSANINRITEAMRSLEAAWKALPNNQKFDINDRLTPKAQEMVRKFNELATASSTYGQTLSQIAGKIKRAADEEAKANQKRNDGYAKLRKTLGAQENSIANLSAKIKAYQQILNSKEIGSRSFERVAEKIRKLTEQLDRAKAKVAELTGQTQSGAARQSAAVKQVSKEFKHQETYVSRLIKRLAMYASFSAVGNFLTSVREVTAQFELQRVSLGAILQDANKGEQIFSQIKQFALKSPISILDLTKYTKQLAAYKIGYDELFDTTKRLADISVGLGVDFQRIVLLYGQVRATGYLRASEVRQATEAGIPLVEELAAKLTKANGELVTAADVMDMVSKRAISFDMVKDVFTDMTSAGGTFYNMQEKQGNTLYGLWAKLGDAASVMYEQIGNTGIVNEGMKEAIQMLTELMRNWKAVGLTAATTVLPAVAAIAAWKMATKALAKSVATATAERIAAEAKLATAMKGTDIAAQNAARSSLAKAKADEAAAIAAQTNATAQSKLKMGFVSLGKTIASGLGIGIAIMLVTNLIYKFYEALTNFRKLKRELGSIYTETATLQDQSVRNFEFLADKAVHAAAGSKEQTDALQELNRTYRDILPQEALTIENLTKMKGKYDALTQSIQEYIAEQQRQKAESAIMEYYGTKIRDNQNEVRERLYQQGLSSTEVGRFFVELERIAPESGKKVSDKFHDAMLKAGIQDEKRIAEIWNNVFAVKHSDTFTFNEGYLAISGLSNAYAAQADELKGMNEQYRESIGNLGKFADMQKRVSDVVANATYVTAEGKPIDPETQGDLLDAMKLNLWVKKTAAEIQNNEDIKEAFAYMGEGIKSEWFNIINAINSNDLGKVSQINFDAIIASVDSMIAQLGNKNPEILAILNTFRNYLVAQKKEYENMVPSKAVVVRWQTTWRRIVKELKISGQNMNRYLMGSAEDFETYRKRIKDEVAAVIKTIALLQDAITKNKKTGKRTKEQQAADEKELQQAKERKAALEKLLAELDKIDIETGKKNKGSKGSKGSKGTKSDTRLQVLQEVAQTLATINKEYDDLAKKEGASKALADIKERFKEVLAYTNKLGGKFGLNFGFPTEFKTLQEYRNAILKVMQSLKGLPKGSEKTILDFKTMIGKADSDYLQKQIEKQLKELADRISRTKTAKEFYEKILGMTGNYELAANIAVQLYGSNGKELGERIKEQFRLAFATLDKPDVEVSAKISDLIDKGRYEELRDYIQYLPEAQRKAAEDLVKAQQQMSAKQYEQWLKDLEKAKDYADKRIELSRYTANQIAAIEERIAKLDPAAAGYKQQKAMLEKLIDGYKSREDKMGSELEYEQFKNSALYVQVFENLDNASKTALENMRNRLLALKDQWKNLSPEKVKELTKRLEELDAQIAQRNPFKSIADSIKKLREMRMSGRTKEGDAQKAFDAEADRQAAKAKMLADEKAYEAAVKQYGAESDIAKAKRKIADDSADAYRLAEQAADSAAENADEWENVAEAINAANQKIDEYQQQINEALDGIRKMMVAFGASDEDMQFFDDVVGSLNEIVDAGQQAAMATANIMSGNPLQIFQGVTQGVSAIGGLVSGFTNLFSAGKVRKANKEIKRQQKLLEQLQYTYGRLEAASDKLFGRDYLNNYNQQLKNLQAQQAAYEKQAAAERSKGKKKDKEKIKEYENQARETADKIKELQDDLVAHFTGSTKTDVARQMAKSWVDARASMSDTFAAIKGDYQDLIKNMIVEGAAARVIENALTPVWDSMEKMLAKNDVQGAIDSLIGGMDSALNAANNGMEVLWKALEARGYDMKSLISNTDSEYSGMAKSVAGATSEEINNVAAIGNTLMYYVSPIPRIDENLARVVAIMEAGGGASATTATTSAGWTDWQQQAMDNYQAIARNTAETVVRCERAAIACEKMARAIKTKGATSGFNVFLNS